jgi:hypothetical protein
VGDGEIRVKTYLCKTNIKAGKNAKNGIEQKWIAKEDNRHKNKQTIKADRRNCCIGKEVKDAEIK